ncbi:MAG TPA: TonB-dependent receptor [Arachidicoccus sp.]|nr:TonB-dependent receptor [Arachidicoccus sp.]
MFKNFKDYFVFSSRHRPMRKSLKKIRVVFICIVFSVLTANATGLAQNVNLNFSNTPLEKILGEIQSQTGYAFMWDKHQLESIKPIKIKCRNTTFTDALKTCLNGTNLTYEIHGKVIYIKDKVVGEINKNENSLLRKAVKIEPIHGRVTDSLGHPMAGVSVLIEGSNKGTVTDSQGYFSIEAEAKDRLHFRFVGYKSQEVTVGKDSTIDIEMLVESTPLDDIVVVGYGTQKKVNLTGSVVALEATELEDRPNPNMLASVQGKIPGVTIISRPGETPSVNFRGRGNLGESAPLYVINGAISNAAVFASLDPNSVASISFLKDAASSSIYGSRAAYGVILVTTKSGQSGKINISYNGFVGSKSPTYIPKMLNSAQYAELYNEGLVNQGRKPLYTEEEIQKFRDGSDPDHYPNTDWFDQVLDQPVLTTQHSLSFSGGSDNIRYFTSLSYLYDDQFMPGQNNKRYNLYTNLSADVASWLTINTDISYISGESDRKNGATSNYHMMFEPPIMVARQSNGEWGSIAGGVPAMQTYMNYNPLREVNSRDWATSQTANTIFNIGFDLKPVKGLVISGKESYAGTESKSKTYTALRDNIKFFETGSDLPGTGNTSNSMSMSWGSTTRLISSLTAKYDWSGSEHAFTLLAGTSYEHNKYEGLSASRKNFPTDDLEDLSSGSAAGVDITNGGGLYEYNLNSYFGRLNYSYLDRYLLEADLRTDGSSRFYKDARWGVFPAVSAGWLISREKFMQNTSWINLLKIRGSYGSLGNINNVGNYDYFQTYNNSLNYNFDDQFAQGMSEAKPANDKLSWEKVTIADLGLDLSLFNNQLSFTADYYIKNTNNILLGYNVPLEFGIINNPSQNIGKLKNTGLELSIDYHHKIGEFKYSIGANAAFNKNEVTDLGSSNNMITSAGEFINYIFQVGQPIGAYYGYVAKGLYTQQEIDKGEYYRFGRVPKAGDIKYIPQRPDIAYGSDISGEDRTIIGCDVPKMTYGINLSLNYKNFGLSVYGQGVSGVDVAFENDALLPFFEGGNARAFHMGRWTQANPNPNAIFPRIYGGSSLDNYNRNFSTYSLFDADYFRFKTISLSYDLPSSLLQRYQVSSLRLFVNLENMFTIRADKTMKDFDPETASGRSLAIGTKTISFGLKLNL